MGGEIFKCSCQAEHEVGLEERHARVQEEMWVEGGGCEVGAPHSKEE